MAWKLASCAWEDNHQLNAYLADSWEPFAVTETEDRPTVWLRRSADPQDARTDIDPRRFASVGS
jgi:hypothetical protein